MAWVLCLAPCKHLFSAPSSDVTRDRWFLSTELLRLRFLLWQSFDRPISVLVIGTLNRNDERLGGVRRGWLLIITVVERRVFGTRVPMVRDIVFNSSSLSSVLSMGLRNAVRLAFVPIDGRLEVTWRLCEVGKAVDKFSIVDIDCGDFIVLTRKGTIRKCDYLVTNFLDSSEGVSRYNFFVELLHRRVVTVVVSHILQLRIHLFKVLGWSCCLGHVWLIRW